MARQISRTRTAPPDVDAGEPEDYSDGDDTRSPRDRRAARSEPARGTSRRRRDPEADLDERPSRSSGRKRPSQREEAPARREPRRSKEEYNNLRAKNAYNSKDEMRIKEEDTDYLFAFLDEDPIDMWYQHFIMELPKGVRKSYNCSETQDCPLCDLGDNPRLLTAWNVAEFDDKGNYEVKYYLAIPSVQQQIDKVKDKYLPLNSEDNFFIISKSDKKYLFERVPTDELEDYGVELSEAERLELLDEAFQQEDVYKPDTRASLREAARLVGD